MGSGGDHYLMSATNRTKKGSPTSWVWGELDCATDTTPSGSPTSWQWIPRDESVADIPTGTEDDWTWTEADCLIPSVDFTITVNCGVGGIITPAGPIITVDAYSDKTFTITANAGYNISSVLVDGFSEGAISSYIFTNIIANHSIAATFAINTYTITASSGSGGTVTPTGISTVNYGASKTYTITASIGYTIQNVLVDSSSVGSPSTYTFTSIGANHTISATFLLIPITNYTITASAGGGGTITPSGIVTVPEHTNKYFYATANVGYDVAYLKIDGVDNPVSYYTFNNVTTNHTIVAYFSVIIAPPPIHEETRYFTMDTGGNGYEWLKDDNSYASHGEYYISKSGDYMVFWGIRVYVRTSLGVETEITSKISALTSRSTVTSNYVIETSILNMAERILANPTDRIVVKVYAMVDTDSWRLLGVGWSTGALSAEKLLSSTWTIYYWVRRGYSGGTTYGYFGYGDIRPSRITGFRWQEPAP